MAKQYRLMVLVTALALGAAPALADVKAGVDAWSQGDYAKALKTWRPLAEAGDSDAQFNMAQAYKMGRGVPQDMSIALDYYRKAAAQGHTQAEDQYGLLLYQQGQRPEAMPYLQRAAERGETRAQYLVGISLFNGDLLPRDWVRAYAMMTRASAAGVDQATKALEHMDRFIPEQQRRDGLAMAAAMESRMAHAGQPAALPPPAPAAAPLRPAPSTAPVRAAALPSSKPTPPKPIAEKPASVATSPATAGGWQVQLGAFGEATRAEAQWKSLSAKVPALASYRHSLQGAGAMTRLLAGPLKSRTDAEALCTKVQAGGGACIVKPL